MTPDELLLYFGGTVALIICILIGRFMDPAWRCTKMRQFTKKPYILAKVFNKDARLVNTYVINAASDSLWIGECFWAFTAGTVVIERKNSSGKLERDKELGFKINSSMLKTDEGCPTLYLDGDRMTPLKIWKPVEGEDTKPNEVGSIMLGWTANQLLKATHGIGNRQGVMIVIMIIAIASLVISWDARATGEKTHDLVVKTYSQAMNQSVVIAGQGGTMNIVQPKG